LVTGASGFIGPHLCRRLCNLGTEVHGVSRAPQGIDRTPMRWWQADLADPSVARSVFEQVKPDIVFHLAGQATGSRDLSLVLPTFRNNLATTVNILISAAEIGCDRVLLANSMEEPEFNETVAVPSSPYAVSKWAGGAYGRMFHTLYHVPSVILRVFMTYGPGYQDLRKLIPYVTLALLRGETPQLAGGQRQIDWIYIDDVVDAFIAAAEANEVEGKTIDVGTGELVTVRHVVEQLARVIDSKIVPQFGTLLERPLEQVRAADAEKSYVMIGWRPKTNLNEGLERTVDWYEDRLQNRDLGSSELLSKAE
jgi:UDP-glucose 4-epimerase